jgi:nitrite reductase (NADH) large subunit
MGVELVSLGEKDPAHPDDEVIIYRDPARGIYKKMIVRQNKIYGAILLGDTQLADDLMRLYKNEGELPSNRAEILFGSVSGASAVDVVHLPDTAQICNCNGVRKKEIMNVIVREGCTTVASVGARTKAGKGCGSCRGMIARLIEAAVGEVKHDPKEHYYVPGIPLEKSQLVTEIRARELKSVSAVFRELAGGKEDPDSKAGPASLLKTLWPGEYEDERDARFINDRVHANIQKDGTFSVVPRIYAGVTTPQELIRIAQVAAKYQVKMVKLTGGQRIDLLGVNKEDLPAIWREPDMPSGHAYTKAFRTCKSCVGTDFCRFGLGDSIALAQKIERRFQGGELRRRIR